jgi:type I protein arginine methyltransferase
MLSDTGTYQTAILENRADFEGKVVMDVGAGSGILSLFAVQAGAAKVYAVEASEMATYARQLADQNAGAGSWALPAVLNSHLHSFTRCSPVV